MDGMTPLVWSKEPPTEPGWYWVRLYLPGLGVWHRWVTRVNQDGDTFYLQSDEGDRSEIPTAHGINKVEFAGPIPQPAEPTEPDVADDDGETHRLLPFPQEPTEVPE